MRRKPEPAPAVILPPLTEPQDGVGWGLRIQRYHDMRIWASELEKVPEQHRAEAERYLRSIAARMRVVRAARAGK